LSNARILSPQRSLRAHGRQPDAKRSWLSASRRQGNIARLERGRTQVTIRTLQCVAAATGHSLICRFRAASEGTVPVRSRRIPAVPSGRVHRGWSYAGVGAMSRPLPAVITTIGDPAAAAETLLRPPRLQKGDKFCEPVRNDGLPLQEPLKHDDLAVTNS
jgi:hypothetical protein